MEAAIEPLEKRKTVANLCSEPAAQIITAARLLICELEDLDIVCPRICPTTVIRCLEIVAGADPQAGDVVFVAHRVHSYSESTGPEIACLFHA